MSPTEFVTWFSHHMSRFPSVASWFGKLPTRPNFEGDPTAVSVRDAWEFALRDVRVDDAKTASDRLHSGEEKFSEKAGFDHHPRDVRRIAREMSGRRLGESNTTRYIAGEITYKCHWCQDSGVRQVIHPKSLMAARELVEVDQDGQTVTIPKLYHKTHNPEGKFPLCSAAVACGCETGDKWLDFLKVRFDDKRHLDWNGVDDQWQAVRDFSEGARSSGYETNLDEWDYQSQQEEF